MGFFDKLFGIKSPQTNGQNGQNPRNDSSHIGTQPFGNAQPFGQPPPQSSTRMAPSDEQALARYRYMLQTAPPATLEQAHEEAFAQLTPEQRQMVLQQIAQNTPDNERAQLNDDSRSLARAATRAEMRQPGLMERSFGGGGMSGGGMGGMGMSGLMMGGLLTSIAGGFVGSAIANQFFNQPTNAQGYAQSDMAQGANDTNFNENGGLSGTENYAGDAYDPGLTSNDDPYVDPGAAVDPYGDPGATDSSLDSSLNSDTGFSNDVGGDFGGGDFGGGDFGGDF